MCCDLLDHSSSAWFRRPRSCERYRSDDRPTRLAQAVAELGRIDKTIHALTFIDDESKRRRILQQLNKGEDVISWLEPYSTESEASSASDIVKDRKINLERLDWL